MINQIRKLYVDKTAGTLADALLMFGVAELANSILRKQVEEKDGEMTEIDVQIKDCGSYYALSLSPPISLMFVQEFTDRLELAPLLVTLKNRNILETPEAADENRLRVDYEEKKRQLTDYIEWRKNTPKSEDIPPEERRPLPDPDWAIYRALNPAALPGYNNVLQAWGRAMTKIPGETLKLCFDLFSTTPNNVDASIQRWKKLDKTHDLGIKSEITNLQLYNPDQGKGQNRPKADKLEMNNVSGFWMLEALKAAGLYQGGITNLVQGIKDRKTYVVAPTTLSYLDSRNILALFKPTIFPQPAIKFDIKAAIEYCRAMFAYAQANEAISVKFLRKLAGTHPRNIVNGFYTAYYKDLGNATATMNVSHFRLPGWIPAIHDREDINTIRGVLDEFDKATFSIDESKSDGVSLLQALRDFISGSELAQFFAFTTSYAGYCMQRRERNQYVHQFSTDAVRSVIMGTDPKLSDILDNEGFKNIAYAIRQSTVTAQYKKAKLNDRKYDVRYGLNQELARRSRYPQEFIAALMEFLHKYNAENANVMETRPVPYRRNIRTDDIEEIVTLVDQYGSELIANLLIAYGYASLSKTAQDSPDTGEMPDSVTADSDDSTTSEGE